MQASTAPNWAQRLGISSRNLNILVAAALIGSQHWGMNQFVNWSQPEFRERAGTVVVVSVVVAVVIVVGRPPWLTLADEFKVWLCPSSTSARCRTQGWKNQLSCIFRPLFCIAEILRLAKYQRAFRDYSHHPELTRFRLFPAGLMCYASLCKVGKIN